MTTTPPANPPSDTPRTDYTIACAQITDAHARFIVGEEMEKMERENTRLRSIMAKFVAWQEVIPGDSVTIDSVQGELDSLGDIIELAREALAQPESK